MNSDEATPKDEATRTAVDASPCAFIWDSFIGPIVGGIDDGEIDVHVDSTGKISGTHLKTNKPIDGQCTRGPLLHSIKFSRTHEDCTFTYEGIVGVIPRLAHLPAVPPFAAILGKVTTTCPMKAAVDDDWIGTHTT